MLRRLILVVVVIFGSLLSESFPILICLGFLIINLLLQIKYCPYNDDKLNFLEKMSLSSSLIVFFNGIYFQANQNSIIDWIMIILMVSSAAYFILNWFVDYVRVMAVSFGGRIGNLIIKILGNPENLRKPPKSKSGINKNKKKDSRDTNSLNNLIKQKSKIDNKFKTANDIEIGSLRQNTINPEVSDLIDLYKIEPANSFIMKKNRIDFKNNKAINNLEMGSLGQNTDSINALNIISNKISKNKRDKKFGSSILF